MEIAGITHTYVSTQVVKETCNILHKKFKLSWQRIEWVVNEIESNNEIIQVKLPAIKRAIFLADRYQFQWFDSIIVASALESGCTVLYSEVSAR
ncbi:PIN domain-containing protein [Dyadobacter arcticus]|uniref:PIN domain-containing protein n=1 Tax=Dyadobacter arcticus TaxID=1078754 RepID=UPI001420F06B